MIRASPGPESPAVSERLMEEICAPDNMEAALRAVVHNKGAAGVVGLTVHPHPTLSEMMYESVLDAYGRALHM